MASGERVAIGAVCCIAATVYVRQALVWQLGYDEAWHVFSSTVHPVRQFVSELRREAHPPLHYLLLRLTTPHGGSLVWPRLVSILAGVATVALAFVAARELRMARPIAVLTGLAFALAPAHVNLAACVRGYALATAFTLLVFVTCLRRSRLAEAPDGARLGAAALLALASEYSAAIAVAAIVVVFWLLGRADARRASALGRRDVAWLLASVTGVAVYRRWTFAPAYAHLTQFFPLPDESRLWFAFAGTTATLDSLLAPLHVRPDATGAAWCAAAALAMGAGTWRYLAPRSAHRNAGRASVLLVHAILWIALLSLSLVGLYPFGGRMRQQFVLFPFLLLTLMLAADELYGLLRSRWWHASLTVLLLCGIVLWFRRGMAGTPLEEFSVTPIWQTEITTVSAALESDDAVYVDQYDAVGVFGNLRDLRWVHRTRLDDRYDVFTARSKGRRLTVIRDGSLWTAPSPPTSAFVADVAHALRAAERTALWVVTIPQAPVRERVSTEALAALCAEHGLALDRRLPFREGEAFRVVRRETVAADAFGSRAS